MRCARCEYTGDLERHAADARTAGLPAHPVCVVCTRRSLPWHAEQTCAVCVARVRVDLAEIATGYPLMRPSTLEALTLLGDGTMQRRPHDYETASRRLPAKHWIRDEWASDPLPVLPALASWEDYWRAGYGDPAGGQPTLTDTIGYLTRHLDDAAQHHPAFADFAVTVRQLRNRVMTSAGLADVPVNAPAECFDCGGRLLRTFTDLRTPVRGRLSAAKRHVQAEIGKHQAAVKTAKHAAAGDEQRLAELLATVPPMPGPLARRELVRAHVTGRAGEGLVEDWTCDTCGRTYDQPSYFLALRAARSEAHQWLPVPTAATFAGHPSTRTIRTWITRGLVAACCGWEDPDRPEDWTLLAWWPDVASRTFTSLDGHGDEQAVS